MAMTTSSFMPPTLPLRAAPDQNAVCLAQQHGPGTLWHYLPNPPPSGNLLTPCTLSLSLLAPGATVIKLPPSFFFGDIALAFPAVNRDILLVRLADAGVPAALWQHVLALHRTGKINSVKASLKENRQRNNIVFRCLHEQGRTGLGVCCVNHIELIRGSQHRKGNICDFSLNAITRDTHKSLPCGEGQ
jgi:hypothetical protein